MKKIVKLDVLTGLFLNVLHKGEEAILYNRNLKRVFIELEKARLFYWVNTYCTLNLYFTWFISLKPISFKGWWLPPKRVYSIIDEALEKCGLSREDNFDSVVAIWATPKYYEVPDPIGRVWGPGGTILRYSSFQIDGALTWLFVHEFHHQLDEFLNLSGYPEYPHADYPQKLEGFFGEHFDFNAYILRSWPSDKWLDLRYPHPEIIEVKDADNDGIPDENPYVPIDEMRFGSNPGSRDTDGDGLDDLSELMAGIYFSSNPRDPDTDKDGIPDGLDEYPLYPVKTTIKRKWTLLSDGFMMHRNFWINPVIYAKWSKNALYLRFLTNNKAKIFIYIDANADSWFHGKDNYEIIINPASEKKVDKIHVLDCTNKVIWDDDPKYGKDRLVTESDVKVKVAYPVIGKYSYKIDVEIKKNRKTGLIPSLGKYLGLRIEFRMNEKWASLIERYRFIRVKLVDREKKMVADKIRFIKYVPPPYIYLKTYLKKTNREEAIFKTTIKNYGSKARDIRADVYLNTNTEQYVKNITIDALEHGELIAIESKIKLTDNLTYVKPEYRVNYRGKNGLRFEKRYRDSFFVIFI